MKIQKVGQYYFARHRGQWGIWKCTYMNDKGCTTGEFVKHVIRYDDAVRETYELNGWKVPENIITPKRFY